MQFEKLHREDLNQAEAYGQGIYRKVEYVMSARNMISNVVYHIIPISRSALEKTFEEDHGFTVHTSLVHVYAEKLPSP